jgi:parallel beta-helix repeat protein
MRLKNCTFDGFDYPVHFGNGAGGSVKGCLILNPGRCGITIGENSTVDLERNIVSGSGYYGIRCTGGKITAEENLIVSNRIRGFYIGNRSATGKLLNNLILDNGIGISVHGQSDLKIENNIISGSTQAGLSIIEIATLKFEDNIVINNEKGAVGFSDMKDREVLVKLGGKNIVYGNPTEAERVEWLSETLRIDPQFENSADGLFKTQAADIKKIGLRKPADMQLLWNTWKAATLH